MGNDTFITRQEAASIAKVHLRTIARWLNDGTLTRHRVRNRSVRIERAELERILTPTAIPHDG